MTSPSLTPSDSTTTLMLGWEHWFKLDWSVESDPGGGRRIRGYVTNTSGEAAEPLRLLAQALDASGAVVGQQIAWVPEGVGGFEARVLRGLASAVGRPLPRVRVGLLVPGGSDRETVIATAAVGPRQPADVAATGLGGSTLLSGPCLPAL